MFSNFILIIPVYILDKERVMCMAKEVFNRYEHKYLLSAEVCEKVISEIYAFAQGLYRL